MLVALDPMHFGKTRNFTTRPSRPDDDPSRYYYFEHTESGLAPIFERIKTHELLQYNIDPFSYYIYGSEIEGYTHDYNLGDIWSTSIAGFRQLGFGELYVCSVVTEAAEWLARFDQRFPAGNPLRSARLKEAVVSLEWSLAQTNPDHRLIINRNKMASNAAESVRRFIDGQVEDQAEAKQLALDCLALAKKQNNAQT